MGINTLDGRGSGVVKYPHIPSSFLLPPTFHPFRKVPFVFYIFGKCLGRMGDCKMIWVVGSKRNLPSILLRYLLLQRVPGNEWHASPQVPPAVSTINTTNGPNEVKKMGFMSWNGASNVSSWFIAGGNKSIPNLSNSSGTLAKQGLKRMPRSRDFILIYLLLCWRRTGMCWRM